MLSVWEPRFKSQHCVGPNPHPFLQKCAVFGDSMSLGRSIEGEFRADSVSKGDPAGPASDLMTTDPSFLGVNFSQPIFGATVHKAQCPGTL